MLAPHRKIGGFTKCWRISKILVDFQNIGGFPKYWRIPKIQAPAENQAALLFRLGGISSC